MIQKLEIKMQSEGIRFINHIKKAHINHIKDSAHKWHLFPPV